MAALAIVWRNPEKVGNRLRYLPRERMSDRTTYIVQQALSREGDVWVNTSVLEVISRPREDQNIQKPPLTGAASVGKPSTFQKILRGELRVH